jgi:nitroreductase
MEAIDAIMRRRSIRAYTPGPVSDDALGTILAAAMQAPSAGNQQPWHFVLLTKRELLDRVPEFHPHAAMIRQAPAAILVCGDLSLETHEGMWTQDCAAATENILLAAEALSLGAVWLGVYPRAPRMEGLRRLLGLPGSVVPFSLVPIGHPAEKKAPERRFQESRVHRDGW